MSTKVKGNNKGFSLVELIVVMAIMAILAVTLAPRLSNYVEKARRASDTEVANAVMTSVRLAVLDEKVLADVYTSAAEKVSGDGIWILNLQDKTTPANGVYTVADKAWTTNTVTNLFEKEIVDVVQSFNLKNKNASADTQIIVKYYKATGKCSVLLDYDGNELEDAGVDYLVAD